MQLRVASLRNGDFATIDLTNGFSRSLWLALFNTDSLQENTVEYEEFIEFMFKADEVALMRDVNSEGEEVILFSNTNEDSEAGTSWPRTTRIASWSPSSVRLPSGG